MAPVKSKRTLLCAKSETVYGTDSVPTATANLMLAYDIAPTKPRTFIERVPAICNWSPQRGVQGERHGELVFKTEIIGGKEDTPPIIDPLLKACGFKATTSAGQPTTYKPLSAIDMTNTPSCTIYLYLDGMLEKFTGSRGNLRILNIVIPPFREEDEFVVG